MIINVKPYGRRKGAPCTTIQAGRLEFIAENEVDAVQLAALAMAWAIEPDEHLTAFRKQAIDDYCRKHNVRLVKKEASKAG